MRNLGMGVMLGMLGGNKETVESIKLSLGKTIEKIRIEDNNLIIKFSDGSTLIMMDDGQSCCENRYMETSDDLDFHIGAKFLDVALHDAPNIKNEYGEHEVQFLEIKTTNGSFTMSSHNEHNGYYGGFYIIARLS